MFALVVQFFDGYGYHGTSFEQTYRCYPASFIEKVGECYFQTQTFTCLGCNIFFQMLAKAVLIPSPFCSF